MSSDAALFYGFGALALVAAVVMVFTSRTLVAGAVAGLALAVCLAALQVSLEAYLVAGLQLLVLATGLLALFVHVVMLMNGARDELGPGRGTLLRIGSALLVGAVVLPLASSIAPLPEVGPAPEGFGGCRSMGLALYGDFALATQMVSLLLLSAGVGSLALARRRGE